MNREKIKGLFSKLGNLLANDSARTKDINGYLSVTDCNISKATVNPYYGRDIPSWQDLGLIPDKIYYLLRDPDELQRAVETFNGLPLLREHVSISAKEIPKELIIGSVGTNTHFMTPHIKADVTVWDEQDIVLIEEDKKKELSSSYFYRADMTAGEFNGVQYDGVMRDIKGNHVAVVERGRAGSDVAVADSGINITEKELNKMKLSDVKKLFGNLLAKDAKDEDIEKALQALKANDEDMKQDASKAKDEDKKSDDEEAKKADDESNKKIDKKIDDLDSEKDDYKEEKKGAEYEDKKANDAAMLEQRIEQRVTERLNRVNQAQSAVRPFVGELAMDSASDIYAAGLKHFGVDINGLPKEAYQATFEAVSKVKRTQTANDSAIQASGNLAEAMKLKTKRM